MKNFEKLLASADFSKETNQKNRLFYELFGKPVPVNEPGGVTLLSAEELGMVAGGRDILNEELKKEEEDKKNTAAR